MLAAHSHSRVQTACGSYGDCGWTRLERPTRLLVLGRWSLDTLSPVLLTKNHGLPFERSMRLRWELVQAVRSAWVRGDGVNLRRSSNPYDWASYEIWHWIGGSFRDLIAPAVALSEYVQRHPALSASFLWYRHNPPSERLLQPISECMLRVHEDINFCP